MANFNFNKVILGGRLTADPELKTTTSGVSVTTFTVAVNRKFGNKDSNERQADFISVTAWRQTAEFVTRYFHKGSCICVTGALQTRNWVDQNNQKHYVTEVVAEDVTFVDSASETGASNGNYQRSNYQQNAPTVQAPQAAPVQSEPAAPQTQSAPAYVPDSYGTAPAFSTQSSAGASFAPVADDDELPF